MSKQIDALKLALENYMAAFGQALEAYGIELQQQQIEADSFAREALAQPAVAEQHKQEPVAKIKRNSSGQIYIEWRDGEDAITDLIGAEFYTTPPQRKPLTRQQIEQCQEEASSEWCGVEELFVLYARAIEAAHGIKE